MSTLCTDCQNCVAIDYGWSNWTVEGTAIVCMVRAHPKPEFDRWYGENDDLRFAEQCARFAAGGSYSLDVERENWGDLPDHVQAFINGNECR